MVAISIAAVVTPWAEPLPLDVITMLSIPKS